MSRTAEVVIIGAGIAGISAAYHLAVTHGVDNVTIIDPRPPLTLTSDKSTECYRNWWPDRPMVGLMNRSIDILEELATRTEFGLNRAGYLFVTGEDDRFGNMSRQADDVRPFGADARLLDFDALHDEFPFLTRDSVGALMVPRAGWFRAQDLGQWMLERCRESGGGLINATVTGIRPREVRLSDSTTVSTDATVIAAGPHSASVGAMIGLDLPLFSELHLKVAFKDHLGVIPRNTPLVIWADTQTLDWTDVERAELTDLGRTDVVGEMPIFCHFRPEGGQDSPYIVALWEYHDQVMEPSWPLPEDPLYPEVVMRGLTTMVPGLAVYRDRLPESFVDGGYYTKTRENRPLIGPSGVDDIYLMTGMSGFGVMVSAGAGDLLASHITGEPLPTYADTFLLSRYDDPTYLSTLDGASSGQL